MILEDPQKIYPGWCSLYWTQQSRLWTRKVESVFRTCCVASAGCPSLPKEKSSFCWGFSVLERAGCPICFPTGQLQGRTGCTPVFLVSDRQTAMTFLYVTDLSYCRVTQTQNCKNLLGN